MKFFFFLFSINIHLYINQLCKEMKTCYNCLSSNNNCSWSNNICLSQNSSKSINYNDIINSFLSHPYITSQYRCIIKENDIEIFSFNQYINNSITFSIPPKNFDHSEIINYHIYCIEYSTTSSIFLKVNFIEKYKNNIIHLSLYNNLTKTEQTLTPISNDIKIKITTDFFCIKITYEIQAETTEEEEKIISFIIEQNNEYSKNDIRKNENIISYIILGSIILFITFIIFSFIIWHKNKSGIMKEITILNKANLYQEQQNELYESKNQEQGNASNCDKSCCSELQEKYLQLEQKSFVSHNYDTLDSFANSIHDINKKNKYLKTIIKTLPCFIIEANNRDLIGSFCHFCENKIKLNDNVCLLNCGHIFHYDCIYQQIITNEEYKCIICKESIII